MSIMAKEDRRAFLEMLSTVGHPVRELFVDLHRTNPSITAAQLLHGLNVTSGEPCPPGDRNATACREPFAYQPSWSKLAVRLLAELRAAGASDPKLAQMLLHGGVNFGRYGEGRLNEQDISAVRKANQLVQKAVRSRASFVGTEHRRFEFEAFLDIQKELNAEDLTFIDEFSVEVFPHNRRGWAPRGSERPVVHRPITSFAKSHCIAAICWPDFEAGRAPYWFPTVYPPLATNNETVALAEGGVVAVGNVQRTADLMSQISSGNVGDNNASQAKLRRILDSHNKFFLSQPNDSALLDFEGRHRAPFAVEAADDVPPEGQSSIPPPSLTARTRRLRRDIWAQLRQHLPAEERRSGDRTPRWAAVLPAMVNAAWRLYHEALEQPWEPRTPPGSLSDAALRDLTDVQRPHSQRNDHIDYLQPLWTYIASSPPYDSAIAALRIKQWRAAELKKPVFFRGQGVARGVLLLGLATGLLPRGDFTMGVDPLTPARVSATEGQVQSWPINAHVFNRWLLEELPDSFFYRLYREGGRLRLRWRTLVMDGASFHGRHRWPQSMLPVASGNRALQKHLRSSQAHADRTKALYEQIQALLNAEGVRQVDRVFQGEEGGARAAWVAARDRLSNVHWPSGRRLRNHRLLVDAARSYLCFSDERGEAEGFATTDDAIERVHFSSSEPEIVAAIRRRRMQIRKKGLAALRGAEADVETYLRDRRIKLMVGGVAKEVVVKERGLLSAETDQRRGWDRYTDKVPMLVFTPPQMPWFNPIEAVFGHVKNYVGRQNLGAFHSSAATPDGDDISSRRGAIVRRNVSRAIHRAFRMLTPAVMMNFILAAGYYQEDEGWLVRSEPLLTGAQHPWRKMRSYDEAQPWEAYELLLWAFMAKNGAELMSDPSTGVTSLHPKFSTGRGLRFLTRWFYKPTVPRPLNLHPDSSEELLALQPERNPLPRLEARAINGPSA